MEFPGFFQALSEISERDPDWTGLLATMLTVRVAVAALDGLEPAPDGMRAVRRAIRLTENVGRIEFLTDLLAVSNATARGLGCEDVVAGRLCSAAVRLHEKGYLGPAVDIFTALIDRRLEDPSLWLFALQRRAFASRLLARPDAAEADYRRLHEAAHVSRNWPVRRQADLGLAKVTIERGNIQAAVPMLERVLADGLAAGDGTLVGLALLDRAAVAGIQEDYAGVIRYSREALDHIKEPWQRERCYVNMAAASRDSGKAYDAGHYAALVRERGIHADARARAGIVLYQLAIDARNEAGQAATRKWLESAILAPRVDCEFREAMAYELAMRGAFDDAIETVRSMTETAQRHRIAELVIRGDAALDHPRRRRVPPSYYNKASVVRPHVTALRGSGLFRDASPAAEDVPAGAAALSIGIGIVAAGA